MTRELGLAHDGLRLVAAGACVSVTIGGLRHGPAVIERLAAAAAERDLLVEAAVRYPGETGCGIRIARVTGPRMP